MKFSYYPGCTLKNHAKNFEDSTLFSMSHLGLEVEEMSRWNCCGTVASLAADDLIHQLAPIRNLIRVKEEGNTQLVTACSMCFNTLKRANERVRANPTELTQMNDFMYDEETPYEGDVDVHHVLGVVRDTVGFKDVKAKVVKPLTGLKVANYYGCTLVRPKQAAIDDTENPVVMENLVKALGATPVEYPMKTECCGAYRTVDNPHIVADKTYQIVGSARALGADVIAVSCPLCAYNLDHRQEMTIKDHPDFIGLPVVYFTQLMAIAFGCAEQVLQFGLHHFSPKPVLAGKGLI
ncbi:MAG: CoB--CoM heterodisulfide reductase iron-sulfur subunit B family protein [Alphaproteobacteria bacterium]|nr:CoB--CoM heterodisulfide reductase iron-sulfur subunit B family protein [Alphaproteobacteria bacterium]